jgi:hypothetical protein
MRQESGPVGVSTGQRTALLVVDVQNALVAVRP